MGKIFKYRLDFTSTQNIKIPLIGNCILFAGKDGHGDICVWAEIDPDNALVCDCSFAIIATGHTVPDGYSYIGTVIDGLYVWHIFYHYEV